MTDLVESNMKMICVTHDGGSHRVVHQMVFIDKKHTVESARPKKFNFKP